MYPESSCIKIIRRTEWEGREEGREKREGSGASYFNKTATTVVSTPQRLALVLDERSCLSDSPTDLYQTN